MTATTDIVRIGQNKRRSSAIIHNGVLYLSGQVPGDLNADIAGQTTQVLAKIDVLLDEAGTDKTRVLGAQVWLSSMENFAAMNAVWDAWVVPGQTPTRCCGKVELNNPACLVEIMVTAAL
jgi:enamine deaminase RidA (YjgF/YER057c/UK114 family)